VTAISKPASKRNPVKRINGFAVQRFNDFSVEICILAGGMSKRMGRDKSRLRLGSTTMLGHIRQAAQLTGLPVRVIRRDCVPKCGPLGGIYTALKSTRAEAVLFLACDMPFVTTDLLQFVLRRGFETSGKAKAPIRGALFVRSLGRAGFPFIVRRENVEKVLQQIETNNFSLQTLAKGLRATVLPLTRTWSDQLFNVNTRQDWSALRAKLSRRRILSHSSRAQSNSELPPRRM